MIEFNSLHERGRKNFLHFFECETSPREATIFYFSFFSFDISAPAREVPMFLDCCGR